MRFACQVMDTTGRRVGEWVEAATREEAADIVRSRGLFPVSIEDAAQAQSLDTSHKRERRLVSILAQPRRMVMFTQQMTMLLGTGAGVVPALAAIERQLPRGRWRDVINAVRLDVESGASLAEALGKRPQYFDGVMTSMVAAGESSGTLPDLFARLARMTRQQAKIRNQLVGASIYPMLLVLVAVGVVTGLIGFVLPRFAMLFTNLQVELPTSTAKLLTLGRWLGINWSIVVTAIVLASVGLVMWLRSEPGRVVWDRFVVTVPGVGALVRRVIIARTLRVWGLLLESRIPLLEALQLSRGTTSNRMFRRLFDQIEEAVTEGKSMVPVMERSPLMMPSLVEGIHTGENSGRMSVALLFLADQLEDENEQLLHGLLRVVEPLILIVMGIVVGAVAISLFLPLFDMAAAASGG